MKTPTLPNSPMLPKSSLVFILKSNTGPTKNPKMSKLFPINHMIPILCVFLLCLTVSQAQPVFGGGGGGSSGTTRTNMWFDNPYHPEVLITNQTYITNIVLTNYTGTDLVAGDVAAPLCPISNAVLINQGTGVLLTICYKTQTTNGVNVELLILQEPITWPANSATATLTMSQMTNLLGSLLFTNTDFKLYGTTIASATKTFNLPIRSTTNTVFIGAITRAAITNVGNDMLTVAIQPD